MTAVYIPPIEIPLPPPSIASGNIAFSGQLEVTTADNVAYMQKAVFLDRAAQVSTAWIGGVEGLDASGGGQSVIRLSDHPYDQQGGETQAFDLILPSGQTYASAAGGIIIPALSWLYLFVTQADGGHYGAQVGFHFQWLESEA